MKAYIDLVTGEISAEYKPPNQFQEFDLPNWEEIDIVVRFNKHKSYWKIKIGGYIKESASLDRFFLPTDQEPFVYYSDTIELTIQIPEKYLNDAIAYQVFLCLTKPTNFFTYYISQIGNITQFI